MIEEAGTVQSDNNGPGLGLDLPAHWKTARLGDLFDVQQGKALSPAARAGTSPRPFLRTANVLWGRLDLRTVDRMHFTDEEAKSLSLLPGDLLVCEGGEIGRAALWRGELPGCSYQNHLHRLRPKRADVVVPAFVMHWLRAAFINLGLYRGVGNRTTIPNLSSSRLKELPIPLPPRAEQAAIANILSALQSAGEGQTSILERLRALKAATMAKLFREGVRDEPLKQTEIGEIPESWGVIRLGNYCRIASGGTPRRDVPEYWNGTVPWAKTGEIDYRPITETEEHITELGLRDSAAQIFPAGTLLMAMYGQGVTRGKVAFLEIEAATNQACAALFPNEFLDGGYLYAWCAFAYQRIRELGHGANQKNLSADLIREIRLPLPSDMSEQRFIASVVRTIDTRLLIAERRRTQLMRLFSVVLEMLMTGRVRLGRQQIIKLSTPASGAQPGAKGRELDEDTVREISQRIIEAVAPEKIILFGSAARGEMGPDSDLDLLIVKRGMSARQATRAVYASLYRDRRALGVPVDVIVVSPEDVERYQHLVGTIIKPALAEGRVLYAV